MFGLKLVGVDPQEGRAFLKVSSNARGGSSFLANPCIVQIP